MQRTKAAEEEEEQVVNPWEVSAKDGGKIDYDKLIDKFGCRRLDQTLIAQRLTSCPPHVLLRRGVFFAHRDLNEVLDAYERGDKFYLYTGRGPSSEALHLGIWFLSCSPSTCKMPLRFLLLYNLLMMRSACGKISLWRKAKDLLVVGIFGFTGEDHIGKVSFPPVQAVPSFPSSFPHLFSRKENLRFPCAVDQINKFAFSGGQDSIENHRKYGANLEVDVPIKYLGLFLEDDAELDYIRMEYGAGRMLIGEVKRCLIEVLTELVERY